VEASDKNTELLFFLWKVGGFILLLMFDFLIGFYITFCLMTNSKLEVIPVVGIIVSNLVYSMFLAKRNKEQTIE